MLNKVSVNLSGMSSNFFQDYSLFSTDGEEADSGDGLVTDESSNDTPRKGIVGATDEDEFNDCLDEEEYEGEDNSDGDDSSEEGGRKALAYDVSQLSDLDGPPQNGHDYLRQVERESKAMPSVFSADKPTGRQRELSDSDDKQSSSSTLSAESHKSIEYVSMDVDRKTNQMPTKTPLKSAPEKAKTNNVGGDDFDDLRFREDILDNFKRLREKIDAIRETKTVQTLQEQERISEKQMKKTIDRSIRQANSLIRLMELGHPPQVSTLITKSQLELHMTLEKLADQCDIALNSSRTIHTDWIYSLIAALREPIEPDIYSTLRRLARICIAKRKLYEERTKAAARLSDAASKECGGSYAKPGNSTSGSSGNNNNNLEFINQPTPSGRCNQQKQKQQQQSFRKCQAGKAPENIEEQLVRELEEEEYTSSLLIICIVRYYFGQVDLK